MHLSVGKGCQECGADLAAAAGAAAGCSCHQQEQRRQSLEAGSFPGGVNFIPFFHPDFQLLMQQLEQQLDQQLFEPLPELTGSCDYSCSYSFCPPGPAAPTAVQADWPAARSSLGAGVSNTNMSANDPSWATTPVEGTYLQQESSGAAYVDGLCSVNSSSLGTCLARRRSPEQQQGCPTHGQQPAEQPPRRLHVHLLQEQLQQLQLQPHQLHAPPQQQQPQSPGSGSAWAQLLLQQPQADWQPHAVHGTALEPPPLQQQQQQQAVPGEARHRGTHLSFSGSSLLSEEMDSLTLPLLVHPYQQQEQQQQEQEQEELDLGAQLFVPFFRSEPGLLLQA